MKICSIVVLNWNGATYLRQFIPFLIRYTTLPGVELVVADNASTDDSLSVLRENFPSVRCIVLDQNYGFAGGYNKALSQIESRYCVLLNSDVEVTAGWLEPLLQFMDENTDVAACQPGILSFHNRSQFEHAGAAGGYIDTLGYPFCRGRILSVTETDLHQYDLAQDVFWATGACMVVRSEVFRACGGLDDDFFAHMEEIDLCWRMLCRGYRVAALPQSRVYHVGGGTLSTESPRKTYLNFRNNLLMLYKNLPDEDLKRVMPVRMLLDWLAALHLMLAGKPANAIAVVRARRDFRKMKPDFMARRNHNLRLAIRHDLPGVYKGSMLLQYYLFGKKTFSSLWQQHK